MGEKKRIIHSLQIYGARRQWAYRIPSRRYYLLPQSENFYPPLRCSSVRLRSLLRSLRYARVFRKEPINWIWHRVTRASIRPMFRHGKSGSSCTLPVPDSGGVGPLCSQNCIRIVTAKSTAVDLLFVKSILSDKSIYVINRSILI